jgi:hypothetical protein
MAKTPAANAVLNPKARYARKNQQPRHSERNSLPAVAGGISG